MNALAILNPKAALVVLGSVVSLFGPRAERSLDIEQEKRLAL